MEYKKEGLTQARASRKAQAGRSSGSRARRSTKHTEARSRQKNHTPRPRPRRKAEASAKSGESAEQATQQIERLEEEAFSAAEEQQNEPEITREFPSEEQFEDAVVNDETPALENDEEECASAQSLEPLQEEPCKSAERAETEKTAHAEMLQTQESVDDFAEEETAKKHHFAFYMGWFTLAFTLCSVVLIVALFLFSGNPLFTTAEDVELPNFTQMTQEEVEADPAYSGFNLQFEEEYNADVAAGVIFDQSPKPPKNVKENSVITLFVSKGVEYVEIPDVAGWKRETAREKLKELGVEVLIRYEQSDEEVDTVLRTDPVAGETVQTGTTVSMYVSQPELLKESHVPDCVGKTQSAATALLTERKLKVKFVRRSSSSAKGTVLSQSPQPGILLEAGDTVTLYVSSGEPEVPDVTDTGHVHSWSPPDENGYQFCYVCLQTRKAPQ